MSIGTVPDFFIVGAPKCGTTAMSAYLRAHPNVFMSHPKEPHHFATDLKGLSRVARRSDYLELFRRRTNSHRAVGEASVWYLFSREALPAIHAFNAKARIVVMLRNPLDFLRSYHNHLVFSLIEAEADFRVAWALQEERARGQNLPSKCRFPEALQYAAAARFGEQVARLMEVFPREQVHFIFFEDFIDNPRAVFLRLLDFLQVPDDGRSVFPRVNEARTYRSKGVAKLMFTPPPAMRVVWSGMKRIFGPGIIRISETLLALNAQSKVPACFDHDLRNLIWRELRGDVSRLAQLTNRNLDAWLVDESAKKMSKCML